MVTADGVAVLNVNTGKITAESGDPTLGLKLRAYLQTLYDTLSR